jgi:amide synthase
VFHTGTYLKVLGFDGPAEPTWDTLRTLHRRHLAAIPYDSSLNTARGLGLWAGVVDFDAAADTLFEEIVVGGRGGVCYELNGLFQLLLRRLGFGTELLAAGIRQPDDTFGPDLEHVFGRATLPDGRRYLIDVGYVGPSYLEPLPDTTEGTVRQDGTDFRIREHDGRHVLERRPRAGDWRAVYRYRPEARRPADWAEPTPDMADFAGRLAAAATVIRGRAFATGQRILIGRRLVTVDDGHESMRGVVDPDDYAAVLAGILGRDGTPR